RLRSPGDRALCRRARRPRRPVRLGARRELRLRDRLRVRVELSCRSDLRPAAESGRIVPRRMRRPRLKLVSVPNLVAVTVLGAGAAGLSLLMLGGRDEAAVWFARAAERYRESWPDAPHGSWGRPVGAIKSRILAGDWEGAAADARWALEAGAAESGSPIGRYA